MERLDVAMARAVATYYAERHPFGADGDFTTAPEISQAFGECLGAWAAVVWDMAGRPDPLLLVELGPGLGTLAADALTAVTDVAPPFRKALRVHLVETAPKLRQAQRVRLGNAVTAWHESLATLPPGPAICLANEFLDALPIRQFVRRGDTWRERWVVDGRFVEIDCAAPPPDLPRDAPQGAIAEHGAARNAVGSLLGARVAAQGGAALFFDYGTEADLGRDTLQAVSRHRYADPLAAPGTVDLSAHVDFAAFAQAARAAGASVYGPLPQGVFLQRLGLGTRAAMLAAAASRAGRPDQASLALAGAQRLLASEGMGRLFNVVCLCHPTLPTPPGFTA